MRVAVANSDFSVNLGDSTQAMRSYQVANGEDLKILSKCVTGVIKSKKVSEDVQVAGYLVEIEGQTVFIDENLLEVSK